MLERLIARAGSYLVVVAHPDDETLSAGAILRRLRTVSVLHVTDGAPRDRRFFPRGLDLSREGYAALRREEVVAALSLAGVPADRIFSLGVVDQEAMRELPWLVQMLFECFARASPALVITHPYEGGHPDHDATAFAVHAASARLSRAGLRVPILVEAASYHGKGGRFTPGEFLRPPEQRAHDGGSAPLPEEALFELSAAATARKRAMLACFKSQRDVIASFPLQAERLRVAPTYDFTAAPHEGPLHYERLGFPTSGKDFRALAGACLALESKVGPCL